MPVPHSDFLVHWTGKDIDNRDIDWNDPSYRMSDEISARYVERITGILKHGFWMMPEPARKITMKGDTIGEIPPVVRTCFTELKLSLSRGHAKEYGRLGIAVKRPFVIKRGGRPLVYYPYFDENSPDPFLYACLNDLKDRDLLGFLQPMNRKRIPGQRMTYDLYRESEWRILHRKETERYRGAIPPELRGMRPQPAALLPLDGWLALIIYPSLAVKSACQASDSPVKALIQKIKADPRDHANSVEPNNWPAEFLLDDCVHF
jgi:hypothetical protein